MKSQHHFRLMKQELCSAVILLMLLALMFFGIDPATVCAQTSLDDGLSGAISGQGDPLSPDQNQNGNGIYTPGQQVGGQEYSGQFPSGSQSGMTRSSDLQSIQNQQDYEQTRRANLSREQATQYLLRNLPPDPPTEFQKMVSSSTGRMLPIYGAQLFRNLPSTFAPLDRVPVTPDYLIGPGDELLVQVWGQVKYNSHLTVDRSGNIYIPDVGAIQVAGLTFGQLRDHLKEAIGRVFRNFDLNVNMGQLRSIQIFVVGQARRPGSYTVSSLSTLVDALFVTGGPKPQGSMRHILLKRAGKVVSDFDLYDLLQHGNKANDAQLLPGDVIYIPPVGPQVAVAGSVNTPAIYELGSPQGETVDEVLELAAGATNVASNGKARLERVDAHQMRSVVDLSLRSSDRMRTLQDGDILELVAIVDQFKNGVTLRGNVANPGHYAWHPGMRVGELFPDKDALITRNYWLKRGQLGKPVLSYVPVCPPASAYSHSVSKAGSAYYPNETISGQNLSSSNLDNNNLPQKGQSLQANQQDNFDEEDSRGQDNLDGCVVLPESRRMQDPQQSTAGYTNENPMRYQTPQESTDSQMQRNQVNANAQSSASAMIGREPGEFQPRNEVKLSEPDIDWTYAVIERQDKNTLTTTLLSFNLGKLVLDRDNSENLVLEPNDVVTIFSKADFRVPQIQQTRFVRLEGEFNSAGIYSVLPGETLRDLVKRAGGFTPDAYLYGSEFTRESTRRVQQQRLNEYIDQIALQAGTNSANNASRSVSALDTAAAAAMASQSQNVISSLRQARSTGRIVLQLNPESHSADELPAIALEDGDRFIVPHVPSTVSVAGAVYNANSFIFDDQRRLKDYLQLAGGSNRDADRRSTYVIRADGSVVSRRQISNWRKDSFDYLRIHPGDTVVVPLNLSKGAGLRTVVDIAQIVGQFGVAIAAANLVF